jgi:hypothetical protein
VAEQKVKLTFEADIAQFKKSVQQIPGVTEQQVDKMVQNYKSGLMKIDKSAGETTKSIKKLADGLGFGDKASKVSNLAESVGGLGIAAAGTAVLVGGLAYKFGDVMMRVDDLAPKLALLAGMEIVSASSIQSSRVAEQQIGNLSTVTDGFVAVLVDAYSPAVEVATSATIGLGVSLLDGYKGMESFAFGVMIAATPLYDLNMAVNPVAWGLQAMTDRGREANAMLQDQVAALDAWEAAKKRNDAADDRALAAGKALGLQMEAEAKADEAAGKAGRDKRMAAYAAATEKAAAASQKLHDAWAAEDAAAIESNIQDAGAAFMAYAHAGEAATQATADMWAELDTLIDSVDTTGDSLEKTKATTEELTAGWSAMGDVVGGFATALGSLADQEQAHHEAELAQIEESIARKRERLAEALKAGNTELAAKIKNSIQGDKAIAAAERKAAKRAYAASQAVAVMGIAISTAQATMALLASPAIAPLGPAAPAVAAGIAIATGAISAAAVLAAPAPKFHAGRAPDEQSATLTRSEAVLNPRAVANVGGAQGVNALNAGASMGGGSSPVYLAIDGRQADLLVSTGLRSGKSTALALQARRDALGAGHYGRR